MRRSPPRSPTVSPTAPTTPSRALRAPWRSSDPAHPGARCRDHAGCSGSLVWQRRPARRKPWRASHSIVAATADRAVKASRSSGLRPASTALVGASQRGSSCRRPRSGRIRTATRRLCGTVPQIHPHQAAGCPIPAQKAIWNDSRPDRGGAARSRRLGRPSSHFQSSSTSLVTARSGPTGHPDGAHRPASSASASTVRQLRVVDHAAPGVLTLASAAVSFERPWPDGRCR